MRNELAFDRHSILSEQAHPHVQLHRHLLMTQEAARIELEGGAQSYCAESCGNARLRRLECGAARRLHSDNMWSPCNRFAAPAQVGHCPGMIATLQLHHSAIPFTMVDLIEGVFLLALRQFRSWLPKMKCAPGDT
jgi:hypothetical protein